MYVDHRIQIIREVGRELQLQALQNNSPKVRQESADECAALFSIGAVNYKTMTYHGFYIIRGVQIRGCSPKNQAEKSGKLEWLLGDEVPTWDQSHRISTSKTCRKPYNIPPKEFLKVLWV
jgi:hypothetical protein